MGHSKQVRRADILTLFGLYGVPMRLNDGEIDQCADLGQRDIFAAIFPEQKERFRIIDQTFNDGATLPAAFFGLAARYYILDGNNVEQKLRYINVEIIPQLTRNTRIAATNAKPAFFISDGKFNSLPAGVQNMHIEFFKLPDQLADNPSDDATDNMPEDAEPFIARSGFEFALKLQIERQQVLQLTAKEVEHMENTLKDVYEQKFGDLYREPGATQ